MKKNKIFRFCQGCIGKFSRIKGNTNYCKLCLALERQKLNKSKKEI